MRLRLLVVLAVLLVSAGHAGAQLGGGSYKLKPGERNLKFAGIPVPGYSDVLGFNLGLVGMAYYKMDRNDENLPPSSTGLFGFYSENNSWMGAAFQRFFLDGDKWRATAALGTGSVKYQFNPASIGPGFPDIFVDYTTATDFVFATGSRRTWKVLYLGLEALSWSAQVSTDTALPSTEPQRYTGPGANAEWDQRDQIMFPTKGVLAKARYDFYDEAFGSDRDFEKLNLTLCGYHAMGDTNKVLAGRILNEGSFGQVPFSAEAIVNGNRNLRGYSNGRYRADQLLTVEAEYRWMFWRRWGAVVFAGLGWSADEYSEMNLADTLPSSGFGVRFRLIEAYKINARMDLGWGKDDRAIYFSIGEAY